MNKVYRHRPHAIDEYLGRVGEDGRVYESRLGPDQYVGRVELENGKIFASQPGPDRQIGRVEPDNGKVYLSRLGPDEYLGRVHPDGKLYQHRSLAIDEYLGRVEEMMSLVHGGGAFLLLVRPAWDEKEALEARLEEDRSEDEADAGETAAA